MYISVTNLKKTWHCKYNTTYNHYLYCNDTVLNSTKHKYTLMVEPYSISNNDVFKQLEYITKDHIVKTALFLNSLMV